MVWHSSQTFSPSSSLPAYSQISLSTRTRTRISLSSHPSPKCSSRRNNHLRRKLLKTLTKPKPNISPPSPQTLQDSDLRKDEIEVPSDPFIQQEEEEQSVKDIVSPSPAIPKAFGFGSPPPSPQTLQDSNLRKDEIEAPVNPFVQQEEEEQSVKEIVSPSPAIPKAFGVGSPKLFQNLVWCFVGLFILEIVYNLWVQTSPGIDESSEDSTGTVGTLGREKNEGLGFDGDESEFKKKVSEIRVLARKARAIEQNQSKIEASSSTVNGDGGNDRTDVRKEVSRRLVKLQNSLQSRHGKPLQPMISDAEDRDSAFTEEPPISSLKVPSDPNAVEDLNNNTAMSSRGASDENNGFLDQRGQPEDVTNGNSSEEEEEESLWLSDEVLKRIVPKVRANEEAGREPYSGLAYDEMNYFLALVRKFRRKGPDYAKQWMEKRIENIDLKNGGTKRNGHEEPLEESIRPVETLKSISRNASDVTEKLIEKSVSENGSFFSNIDNSSCIQEDFRSNPSSAKDSLHGESYASQISEGTNNQNEGFLNGIKSWESQTVSQLPDDVNQGTSSVCGKDILSSSNGGCNSQTQKGKLKQPMLHKVKDCESDVQNNLWWLDLPYVLAIFMHKGDPESPGGLYTLKMKSHSGSESCSYTVAFEDRGDANNFCYLLESFFEDLEDFRVDIMPLSTKELAVGVKSEGIKVLVVRKGQIKLYAGQPLTDVEISLRSVVE